jgi:hypothetical protein
MSRLFVTQRELNFISDITKELISDVVGQKIYYYPISEIKTRVHDVYNESPEKIYDNPIEINCLVDSPENDTTNDAFGPGMTRKLEVFLHHTDMVDRAINVSTGDFLRYGENTYEITKVIQMRNIYGQTEQIDGIKLMCTQAREDQFYAKVLGPTETSFSDRDAVARDFSQTRGAEVVNEKETGDVRALQQNGVLDRPISGPAKVNHADDNDPQTGSSFYDET